MFDAMGVPRTTDGHFEKGSEAPYSSDGMVTFGQAIREGKMDVWTDDFQKLTGQQPLTCCICSSTPVTSRWGSATQRTTERKNNTEGALWRGRPFCAIFPQLLIRALRAYSF